MPYGNVFGFAFLLAMIDWIVVFFAWKRVEYISKPAVILVLLAWLTLAGGQNPQLWWFSAALIFSCAGDIFLLFSNKFLLAGLFSFLIAQLALSVGLNSSFPPFNLATLALFLLIDFTIYQLYRLISAGLQSLGEINLQKPVLIYMLAIGLMVFSALLTMVRPEKEWEIFPAIIVSAGALFFFTSDTLLAWKKFIQPNRVSPLLITITYHLAQFAIIFAAVKNYG